MKILGVTAGILAASVLTACGSDDGGRDEAKPEAPKETVLQAAYEKCAPGLERDLKTAYKEGAPALDELMRIDEDGGSLTIQSADHGSLSIAQALSALECALPELDAPGSIMDRVNTTSAMMGAQDAEWGDVLMNWSINTSSTTTQLVSTFTLAE